MSTFVSPSYNPSQFVSGVPLDLVIQVGSMKQQQYNQAVQNTQDQINLLGQQDIIKDSDKAIINQKLNDTVSKLNQFSSQELSDPRVANQLNNITGQAFNDSDVASRIANNKRAKQLLGTIDDIKKNHPEQYNPVNEAVAMDQFNKWYNDPNQVQFNAQYIPYTDYMSEANKAMKTTLDHPDIQREILYATDPVTGRQIVRGDREVEEITRDKALGVLRNSLSPAAINQMRLEYNQATKNMTVDGALKGLSNQANEVQSSINNLNNQLQNPNLSADLKKGITDLLTTRQGQLQKIKDTSSIVTSTQDPTKYYDENTYLADKLDNIANSYTYKKIGKTDDDFMFTQQVQHANRLEENRLDAQYKYQLELQKEQAKAALKGGVGSINDIMDDDTDQIVNILYNGKGTLTTDQTLGLLNGVGKTNDDGSAQLNLTGRKLYFDITPTLQQAGINPTNELQAGAYQDAQQAYSKWITTKDGQKLNGQTATNSKGEKIINPRTGMIISNTGEAVRDIPKTFDEYLKSPASQTIRDNSSKLGLDLSDPKNISGIKAYLNSPQAALTQIFGKGLDNLPGSANFVPFRQDNIITDKNGDMYTKGSLRMTRGDWITRLNSVTDGKGEKLWNNLIDDGFIKYTSGEQGKNDAIAELVVTTKLDRDLNSYYDKQVRERFTGDKAAAEQIPVYKQNFANKVSQARSLAQLDTRDVPTLVGRADYAINNININKGANSGDIKFWNDTIEGLKDKLNNPNTTANEKIVALQGLDKISKFTSLPSTTNSTSGANADISTKFNNPGNMIFKPWMSQFGAVPSGQKQTDGNGVFAQFPDSKSGFNAYKQQLFGDTDGTFTSQFYKANTPVDQALKKWSNGGYGADIYPEIKNKTLGQLTQDERNELVKRQLQRESTQSYNTLVTQGII